MIKTSYFSKYKDNNGIAISYYRPRWFRGKQYKKLAPSKWILEFYRSGKLTKEQFENCYYRLTLSKLDAREVYNELDGKVLLCYEKKGDFCHRHLVAKWFKKELGIEIEEI